jgi:glycolate oxidase FAD binding subunit
MSEELAARVRQSFETRQALAIRGGASKAFLTGAAQGEALETSGYKGIVDYQPAELVLTARAGTPLSEIEATLAAEGQMLAFEPPYFGPDATLGGAAAIGLSGPRRPYAGALRDFILGARIINGQGQVLTFGGQVMKNVAGYDVSRLMAGAMGTLGVILELSLKVLPRPPTEITLAREMVQSEAIAAMNALAGKPLPLSGACWSERCLYLRLSGSENAVNKASAELGGDPISRGEQLWNRLREHTLDFFAGDATLWRLSMPPATPPLDIPGQTLLDWGGAQRWLKTPSDAQSIRRATEQEGGHATRFHGGTGERFGTLQEPLLSLHRRLKAAFDPANILNPGLLYSPS